MTPTPLTVADPQLAKCAGSPPLGESRQTRTDRGAIVIELEIRLRLQRDREVEREIAVR